LEIVLEIVLEIFLEIVLEIFLEIVLEIFLEIVLEIETRCISTEPEKQFALVQRHIMRIRTVGQFMLSEIVIMVERNLGYATALCCRHSRRSFCARCRTPHCPCLAAPMLSY
jgi:hypothetical protein